MCISFFYYVAVFFKAILDFCLNSVLGYYRVLKNIQAEAFLKSLDMRVCLLFNVSFKNVTVEKKMSKIF